MKMTEIETTSRTRGGEPDCALNRRTPVRRTAAAELGDDVRWERVARLRAAIEAGTYAVSREALAERLMEHMLAAGRGSSPGQKL